MRYARQLRPHGLKKERDCRPGLLRVFLGAWSEYVPIGPKVVPFWDYLIGLKNEPQKGTTLGPMGRAAP